ncbi:MAG: transcription elongation factor GreA [Clostridia bacterium]|nr:transcription elongation factor GreA [Clostridia bacterium]
MEKIMLTEEGKKELEQRLKELKNELIPAVVQRIKTAREQGDLSENAEYHSAKDEQGKLEGEALEIENKLKHSEVVVLKDTGLVQLGTRLIYLDVEENEEFEFTIVGTAEADFNRGKVSIESPVGQALKGKKEGDVVTVKAPKGGEYQIKIIKILD